MTDDTRRRVVVTGLGATTPLGGDVPTTWQAALDGLSGVRPLPEEWQERYDLPVTFAARVMVDPQEVLPRSEIRKLDPSGQYGMIAAREAWADAGSPQVDPERLAVCVASGIGGIWTLLSAYDTLKERGPRRVLPMTVPMLMGNGPAAAIGIEFGARAGVHTAVSACASSAESITQALNLIRSGIADVVVAGGTEAATHPLPIAGFAAMHALSTRNDDPQSASRPYDIDRDGFVMGDGAGILVLESAEHAAARGARVYAELDAGCLSSDGYHIAAPEPTGEGAARAMKATIEASSVTVRDIVHINAHATSTPVGDVAEAKAIRSAFGDAADSIAVTGTKSMTGHLLGAAGALESVLTVLSLHERQVPATTNLDNPDPAIDLDVVRKEPRKLPDGDIAAMNNSFGFGGHNVSLLFRTV
ncbi:MAG: 3-oxoacyl-[acyl-carrier-protein] synthase [Actinomycetota bacterium]|nr:3-oxoacyl-[acyl-carrier-protein] synthase [Actinomycetota bacterium]